MIATVAAVLLFVTAFPLCRAETARVWSQRSPSQRHLVDQAWVIVLHVSDPRAYRPARHLLSRIGREQGCEPGRLDGLLPKPLGPALWLQHDWHPVVQLRTQLVGRRR